MELRLARSAGEASWPCRTVRADDVDSLAVLLYAAFRGTIDDEGESFADALAEIERTFAGGYGKLLTNCSFVAEKGEFLVSACLIGLSEPGPVPLVIFSMTRPDAHVTVGAVSCCADRCPRRTRVRPSTPARHRGQRAGPGTVRITRLRADSTVLNHRTAVLEERFLAARGMRAIACLCRTTVPPDPDPAKRLRL